MNEKQRKAFEQDKECNFAIWSKEIGRFRVNVSVEILLNSPLVADLILKGETGQVKEAMAKSVELGMQTFDQALFNLSEEGKITRDDALRNADSLNELRLRFKLHGKSGSAQEADDSPVALSLQEEKKPEKEDELEALIKAKAKTAAEQADKLQKSAVLTG
jgi:Tfp pilus assembly ATPase PilU